MDTILAATTWPEVALTIWKDVWGYMVSTGIGLIAGLLLPQVRLRKQKPA